MYSQNVAPQGKADSVVRRSCIDLTARSFWQTQEKQLEEDALVVQRKLAVPQLTSQSKQIVVNIFVLKGYT